MAWGAGTPINAAGIRPLLSTSTVDLGASTAGQETRGDFALWAYWNRKLSDTELLGVFNASRRIVTSKGGSL